MIEISHVSKHFGTFKCLDDIIIRVREGTIHGIIGENGAGKTTLIHLLVGIYRVEEGEVKINGASPYENRQLKEMIGYVADHNNFFKGYRVREMVTFFETTYPTFSQEKFNRYNEVLRIPLDKKIRQLSKGMQMRLAIMLNLAISPKVLILDEPTSGLDAIAKKQVLDMIIEEVEENHMTVVISSHHLLELERLCDEISIIHNGRITYQSSVDTLKEKVRKLQVVFKGEVPKDLPNWESVVDVSQIGSVNYVVTNNYTKKLEEKLIASGAIIVEPIGLTLEEVFIYTNSPARAN